MAPHVGYMGAWQWQPVEDLLRGRLGEPVRVGTLGVQRSGWRSDGTTDAAIAEVLGCHRRQGQEWRKRGSLTTLWADRAAVALGLHPALIWDGWYSTEEAS
jgi:hypothetical protein